jgi:hypothetical protein
VLLSTAQDALEGVSAANSRHHSVAGRIAETKAARRYLTAYSEDLATVCSLAGFDVDFIMQNMRRLIAEAPPVEVLVRSRKKTVAHQQLIGGQEAAGLGASPTKDFAISAASCFCPRDSISSVKALS